MKKNFFRFSAFLIVFLLLTACASTEKHRSFGEVIGDSLISNKLKIRYFKDKGVEGTHINIDTAKGVVTLKGKQERQEQINRAIELAESQKGVREVKSYLVLTGSPEIREAKQEEPSEHSRIEEKDLTGKKSEPSDEETSAVHSGVSRKPAETKKTGDSGSTNSKPSKVFAD